MSRAYHPLRCLLLLLAVTLAGCVSRPVISTDTDPQADFGAYRSFGFYSPLAIEPDGYATPASGLMKAAVRRELEARGYVYEEGTPDLLVNINAYMNERTDVVSIPEIRHSIYYSYRANAYFASPYWTERTSVNNYTEGTLNIDLVDARRKALAWEGMAVGRVARMKPGQRAERINATVAEIFAQYPHRAGSR
ncbi:DUF4136 domain-containing protein [Arenimonas sp. MALMAid1274]|uniref:DUF4136 domain-containing protein n=1 Tax=Arenimonas sp. MALMAid1274 TaxID=3411630 RepID=UPI003BA25D79